MALKSLRPVDASSSPRLCPACRACPSSSHGLPQPAARGEYLAWISGHFDKLECLLGGIDNAFKNETRIAQSVAEPATVVSSQHPRTRHERGNMGWVGWVALSPDGADRMVVHLWCHFCWTQAHTRQKEAAFALEPVARRCLLVFSQPPELH